MRVPARGRLAAGRFHLPETPQGELVSRSPVDPADVVGVFPYGEQDVPDAVVAASRAARAWGARPPRERVAYLTPLRAELLRRMPELIAALQRETGRPTWECEREARGLLGRLDFTAAQAEGEVSDRVYGDMPARVISRPLGAVAILGPAMLPLSTSHTHILAALCAGNTVVWKPSPLCPASAQLYAEAALDAGLPSGVFNFVQGDDATGAALCAQPQLDGIVFTGAAHNGARLRRLLCERFDVQLVLHLGAKNAAVVLEDADVPLAAYEVVTGAFQSAGQRCTAMSRALVHEAVLDEFITAALAVCGALRIGPPGPDVFMGPMLGEARLRRFLAAMDGARAQGAEVVLPGARLAGPGAFVSPSLHVVHERDPAAPYQRDEHFGPDLAIYPVRDVDDALQLCDESPYGLCAALFSKSPVRWKRFAEEVRAGALFWNRGTGAPSGLLPFGGVKLSGSGGRGGADAMRPLCREVSLLGRTSEAIEALPGTLRDDIPPAEPPESEDEAET